MIQQNSPNPQRTKPHRILLQNHLLPSNTSKDLKKAIISHLHSHHKLILSIEPLPNPSDASVSRLLTPSDPPFQIEIRKKNIPLATTQNYPQREDLKASYLSAENEVAPLKYQNNYQHTIPKRHTQKKSSKVSRYKSPSNAKIIHISNRRAPDLAINPLKEEIPLSTVRVGTGFNKRIALQNPQNTSHIGAVLECLYHLPDVKNLLSLDNINPKDPDTNQLKLLLNHFFHLMDTSSAEFVNQAAWEITQYLLNNSIHQVSRDPVQVFRTIIEEFMFHSRIPFSDDNDNFEALKLIKNLHIVEISIEESIMACLLDKPSMEISFSNQISFEQKSLRNLKDFPQIIAIAIQPNTKRESVMQNFTVHSSRKGEKKYEFHAGIFETKGEFSNRSFAVIQCNGKGGSYYQFEDNSVKKVQLNEKLHIPRVIFYRSEN